MGSKKYKRTPVFKDKTNENANIVSGLPKTILKSLEVNEKPIGKTT